MVIDLYTGHYEQNKFLMNKTKTIKEQWTIENEFNPLKG